MPRGQRNYANGKIYSIRSRSHPELVYYGSTCMPLNKRHSGHKHAYKQWQNDNCRHITSFEIIQHADSYIELVEDFPCERKEQLLKREGEIIRENECVNKVIPGRTKAEYYEDNREHIRQVRAEYYENNRERINQQHAEYDKNSSGKIRERKIRYRANNLEKLQRKGAEYYKSNREEILQRHAEYRAKNRKKIHQKVAVKVICNCGATVTHQCLERHKQSKKHQFWQTTYDFIQV